ncbi:redoxin domain-containing protein [Algoriphagus hitonicola]|uniref:AhpC/TSA family protein n=1 Tax=Algoriphagus hitonicola TaxID=435880 RepID=A0A1I2P915_9BACT|nr:redoxin domain-containing protein [Algoriphagus hitonicola]SFG12003.1 AhpC/TSA family protein [Algoriphagus hitonicola]
MKTPFLILLLFVLIPALVWGQETGSIERLDAITGKKVSIGSLLKQKALVLIFHSLDCPFAKMYEGRIKSLKSTFQNQGIDFVLITPDTENDYSSQQNLKNYIDDSGVNMNYLIDEELTLVKKWEITKVPEVIVLVKGEEDLEIAYRGAIDNNPQAEASVSDKYLERALNQILKGEKPSPGQIRATGCNVKTY